MIGRVAQPGYKTEYMLGNPYASNDAEVEDEGQGNFSPKIKQNPEYAGNSGLDSPNQEILESANLTGDDNKDLNMINPLLYKPASKPPIIREGDWLCPDPTVSFSRFFELLPFSYL